MSPEEDEESKHDHQNRHGDAVVMMNGQGMLEPQPYSAVHDNKNICEDEKSVNESDLSYWNRILIQKLAPISKQKSVNKTSQRRYKGQERIYQDKSIANDSRSEINLIKFL